MARPIKIYNELLGVCYDAQQMLSRGDVRAAFGILEKKIEYIKSISKTSYLSVDWGAQTKQVAISPEYDLDTLLPKGVDE